MVVTNVIRWDILIIVGLLYLSVFLVGLAVVIVVVVSCSGSCGSRLLVVVVHISRGFCGNSHCKGWVLPEGSWKVT